MPSKSKRGKSPSEGRARKRKISKKKDRQMPSVNPLSELNTREDKLKAYTLPESHDKNDKKTAKGGDADGILNKKGEKVHVYRKTSEEIELEEQEVEELVEHELKQREHKKVNAVLHYIQVVAAKADVFAAAHTMPKHQVCIYVAFAMIPMSILTITWDLLAVQVFQIPHLSTINSPGFILVINFVAMPLAMYGYMMEYLMYENSREAILGLICVVVHPVLFLTRAFMEYYYDGYRNEMKLYFENAAQGDRLEYPVGVLTSTVPLGLVAQ